MRVKSFLLVAFAFCTGVLSAQRPDSTFSFRTDLTLTNNGFSIVPAFTLGALLGVILGMVASVQQNRWLDYLISYTLLEHR